MERGRRGKGVVRAGEIPSVIPSAAERMAGGRAGVADLRGPGFLSKSAMPGTSPAMTSVDASVIKSSIDIDELRTALAREARALGFDCIGITAPGMIENAGKYF